MSLLLSSRPVVVIPELAMRLGLPEAMLLQQIQYWVTETTSGVDYDGRRWIYNTIDMWQKQLPFYSESTIKRAFGNLKKLGVLSVEKLNKSNHDMINYYAINYDSELLRDEATSPSKAAHGEHGASVQIDLIDKTKIDRSRGLKRTALNGSKRANVTENTTEITTENKSLLSRNSVESLDEPSAVVPVQPQSKNRNPDAAVSTPSGKSWGTQDDLECAEWLFSRVQVLNPTAKQPNWPEWANEVRLMRQIDGRSHREICELFRAANSDAFWCKNILSPRKLREQWDNLKVRLAPNLPAVVDVSEGHWNSVEGWEETL